MGKLHNSSVGENLRSTFRSLQYRNYRLFFSGQGISLIGTWIQRITTPWLVYHLTGSAFLLGVVGFAGQIPAFLITPFAGVLTDRWNRYHILIVTQVLAMLQALALAILYLTGIITVTHIILLSIMLGCVNAFDIPARQSLVVQLVDKKEDLGNAIALNSTMVNGARVLGPSVAGLLIALTGEGICFLINAITYLFVIASLILMKVPPMKHKPPHAHVLKELGNGFRYVARNKPIKYVILLLALVSLAGMPYTVLMPVFAREVLHGDSHTFGFLMGASGVGALTGALFLASRKSVLGLGRVIPIAASVFGIGLISFALSRYFILSVLLMIITGLGMMLQMASSNTILQTIVDEDKRGRVMSFYAMAFVGTAPFGSLLAGYLAKIIGAPITLLGGGTIVVLGAIVFARRLPELRKIVRPLYVRMGIITEVSLGLQTVPEITVHEKEEDAG